MYLHILLINLQVNVQNLQGELLDLVILLRFRTLSVPFYAMRLSAVTALNISFKRP